MKLDAKLAKLSADEQLLLEFMSVAYASLDPRQISQLFRWVGELDPVLESLRAKKWLVSDSVGRFSIAVEVRDELTMRSLVAGRFGQWVASCSTLQPDPASSRWSRLWGSPLEALRDLRIAALKGGRGDAELLLERAISEHRFSSVMVPHPWFQVWGDPLDERWLAHFADVPFVNAVAPAYLGRAAQELSPLGALLPHLLSLLEAGGLELDRWWRLHGSSLAWVMLLQGAEHRIFSSSRRGDPVAIVMGGHLACLRALGRGDLDGYLTHYDNLATHVAASGGWDKGSASLPFHAFHAMGLIASGRLQTRKAVLTHLQALEEHRLASTVMTELAQSQQGAVPSLDLEALEEFVPASCTWEALLVPIVLRWLGLKVPDVWVERVRDVLERAERAGDVWLAEHLQVLRTSLASPSIEPEPGLLTLLRPKPRWKTALDALVEIGAKPTPDAARADAETTEMRLVWVLSAQSADPIEHLHARAQRRSKRGWSTGKKLAAATLAQEVMAVGSVQDSDRRIVELLHGVAGANPRSAAVLGLGDQLWPLLVGHPRVFWEDAWDSPIDIREGRHEVQVVREAEELVVKLVPELPSSRTYQVGACVVVQATLTLFQVYRLTDLVLQIWGVLGVDGIRVPASEVASVRAALEAIAQRVPVQSDIAGAEGAVRIEADARLVIHLLPWKKGLRLLVRVQPLGNSGPTMIPGEGRSNVMTELGQLLCKTERDLEFERTSVKELIDGCRHLEGWSSVGTDFILEDPQACLETLEYLRSKSATVQILWPEGETLRLTSLVGTGQVRLRVAKVGGWFEFEGSVQVDDELVVDLRELVALAAEHRGRFVPLKDGRFLALTGEFRRYIDALRTYSEGGKTLRIGALAATTLQSFADGCESVESDDEWKRQVGQLKELSDFVPTVPGALVAELRDYQREGFEWMMRLAEWGVGGCLADDMGLGKTVQAIAVLLARGGIGPALVVAPTSVCAIWESECARFAPGLRVSVYRGRDRKDLVAAQEAGDLLIVTYGLLQQDTDVLSSRDWATIVLDEAQAIKNTSAKRTQAALALKGQFRLVTTGTPIENRLGELWSLFRFLNPGHLLSLRKFNDRFVTPIERERDENARASLQRLVRPFVLRRTKDHVLKELPPRTDVTLTITLTQEELAFYEGLRRQAMRRFDTTQEHADRRMDVLAEITRLRLAACHPQLVAPSSEVASSKLRAFGRLVSDLRDSGHRALVFSQFVKHLDILRAWLDEAEIRYQYLDGSTTPAERKHRVEAFQSGEGDVFLISLRAGGFGLNLTAADYVIHMDPWWNPAVEAQASDRAHRIGQVRPVTVYRVVAGGTIEEKIVRLHESKRDLAESLLDGADAAAKLSVGDLLALLREEQSQSGSG